MLRKSLLTAALWLAVVAGLSPATEPETRTANRAVTRVENDTAGHISERRPAESEDAEQRPVAPRNVRVLFIIAKDCDRCESELARLTKPGGDFEAMKSRGWKIGATPDNHVQIVDRQFVSDLVQQLNVHEFPTVACVNDGAIVRSFKEGCTTPLDAWTFGWLLNGKNERPPGSVPEAARVKTTGSYPLRGNHWSVEGDWNPVQGKIIGHLRGPNHVAQLTPSWTIETWSYEELRSLHDDLHERELASGTAPATFNSSVSIPSVYQSSGSGANNFSANRKMLGR